MNRIAAIEDIPLTDMVSREYDLAFFASGHETRASHVASLLSPSNTHRACVFGFDSSPDEGARRANDALFKQRWRLDPVILTNRAEDPVYDYLSKTVPAGKRIRLFVDYSSMTRFWYAAILNWVRFFESSEGAEIDFAYCAGQYSAEIPPLHIDDILSIPGCEGNTASAGPSVALLGLGFDCNSVQCVLDDLEPDIVHSFLASGAAREEYVTKVKHANEELLERYDPALEFPLERVATTLTCLSEVIAPYSERYNVSIIPLGPKPHVLASILLAMTFPQVAALHVSGRRVPPWDALPTDRVVGTRVRFEPAR